MIDATAAEQQIEKQMSELRTLRHVVLGAKEQSLLDRQSLARWMQELRARLLGVPGIVKSLEGKITELRVKEATWEVQLRYCQGKYERLTDESRLSEEQSKKKRLIDEIKARMFLMQLEIDKTNQQLHRLEKK